MAAVGVAAQNPVFSRFPVLVIDRIRVVAECDLGHVVREIAKSHPRVKPAGPDVSQSNEMKPIGLGPVVFENSDAS